MSRRIWSPRNKPASGYGKEKFAQFRLESQRFYSWINTKYVHDAHGNGATRSPENRIRNMTEADRRATNTSNENCNMDLFRQAAEVLAFTIDRNQIRGGGTISASGRIRSSRTKSAATPGIHGRTPPYSELFKVLKVFLCGRYMCSEVWVNFEQKASALVSAGNHPKLPRNIAHWPAHGFLVP